MPRGAKTIENCAGHRTKKEKESRKNAELGQLTGKKLTEFKQVQENETAHKEFQRIQKLLKVVGKDDALYSAGINRYCELVSEIEQVKTDMLVIRQTADKLNAAFEEQQDKEELDSGEIIKFTKAYTSLITQSMKCDDKIMTKRKMMSDIEKENGWTVLSAIRAIPKQAEKSEDDALMKILQGGENNGAV